MIISKNISYRIKEMLTRTEISVREMNMTKQNRQASKYKSGFLLLLISRLLSELSLTTIYDSLARVPRAAKMASKDSKQKVVSPPALPG